MNKETPIFMRNSRTAAKGSFVPSEAIIPSYQPDEHGRVVCVPIPEKNAIRANDGKAFEIANLLYGAMPEQLVQINTDEPMVCAEKITSAAVRRFGELQKQRQALLAKYNKKEDEE